MPSLKSDPLAKLAATINREHEAADRSRTEALEHFRAAGAALLEARHLCPHGTWLKWLADNVRCGKTQAYRYIAWAELPVTGTLDEQEAAWRRISGNAPADDSPQDDSQPEETKCDPTDTAPDTNDSPTVTPVERERKPTGDPPYVIPTTTKQRARLKELIGLVGPKAFPKAKSEAAVMIAALTYVEKHECRD